MADAMGIHPTFLSQVLKEKKEFNAEQDMRAADYMGMAALEKSTFFI